MVRTSTICYRELDGDATARPRDQRGGSQFMETGWPRTVRSKDAFAKQSFATGCRQSSRTTFPGKTAILLCASVSTADTQNGVPNLKNGDVRDAEETAATDAQSGSPGILPEDSCVPVEQGAQQQSAAVFPFAEREKLPK